MAVEVVGGSTRVGHSIMYYVHSYTSATQGHCRCT